MRLLFLALALIGCAEKLPKCVEHGSVESKCLMYCQADAECEDACAQHLNYAKMVCEDVVRKDWQDLTYRGSENFKE